MVQVSLGDGVTERARVLLNPRVTCRDCDETIRSGSTARTRTNGNTGSGLGTLRSLRRRLGRDIGSLRASIGAERTERREARRRELMALACCPDDELVLGLAPEVE